MVIQKFIDSLKTGETKIIQNTTREAKSIPKAPDYFVDALEKDLNEKNVNIAKIKPQTHKKYDDVIFDYYKEHIINRPSQIQKLTLNGVNGFLIVSYYTPLAFVDFNFNFIRFLGSFKNPNESDGFVYAKKALVDADRDLLILLSDWRHFIRAYKLSTMEKLWDFGVYGSNGHIRDNKLYTPTDFCFLPNGNIMVTNFYGSVMLNETETPNYGTVIEIDSNNGEFVKTHLHYDKTGYGWDNECYHPRAIKCYGDNVYIATYRDGLDLFKYENNELKYQTSFNKPKNLGIERVEIEDFIIKDDEIVVLSKAMRKIVVVDKHTMQIKNVSGYFRYEDGSDYTHTTNAMGKPLGLIEYDGDFIVCDYGNNKITRIYKNPYKDIKYDLPDNMNEIIYANLKFDKYGIVRYYKHELEEDLIIVYK